MVKKNQQSATVKWLMSNLVWLSIDCDNESVCVIVSGSIDIGFFMAYKNRPFHGVVDNNSLLISVCVSCFSDPVLETHVILNKSFSKFIKCGRLFRVFHRTFTTNIAFEVEFLFQWYSRVFEKSFHSQSGRWSLARRLSSIWYLSHCGRNPVVRPFKWNLLSKTFMIINSHWAPPLPNALGWVMGRGEPGGGKERELKAPESAIAAGRLVGRQTRYLVSVLTKRGINRMKKANLY